MLQHIFAKIFGNLSSELHISKTSGIISMDTKCRHYFAVFRERKKELFCWWKFSQDVLCNGLNVCGSLPSWLESGAVERNVYHEEGVLTVFMKETPGSSLKLYTKSGVSSLELSLLASGSQHDLRLPNSRTGRNVRPLFKILSTKFQSKLTYPFFRKTLLRMEKEGQNKIHLPLGCLIPINLISSWIQSQNWILHLLFSTFGDLKYFASLSHSFFI